MKRFAVLLVFLAACTQTPSPQTTPTPAAPPPRSPNALTKTSAAARAVAAPRIRVGMLSDQSTVSFPRVDGGYFVVTDGGETYAIRRGFTVTAPLADAVAHYAVQVSAISDQSSADALVAKLKAETSQRIDDIFDPAGGAHRIIAGDFPDSASANPLRDQLTRAGYGQNLQVVKRPSDQPFEKKQAVVDDEGDTATLASESILIIPQTADTILIDKKQYRTAARLFVNARGLLNVINELNFEEYLYGVVPAEMGPSIYDELEGLKAQAVAARTYAVRNLNQFAREGYDICPGPACQAYNGFTGEAALSTQAVKETAGLVMTYNGEPIDALFTSTCGGETSDVGTMFPGRNEPYLKRARCVEFEMTSIAGRADSGILTDQQVNARLFAALAGLPESGTSWAAGDVEAAANAAARFVSFAAPATLPHATSSRRGDVLTYLAALFGFDAFANTVTLPEDRKYYFPQSTADSVPYRAAAFLIKYGFLPSQDIDRIDLATAMPREELYGLLGTWLRKHSTVPDVTGKIFAIDGRKVTLKADGKTTSYTLPPNVPLFRRIGDRYQEYASLPVMIGDRAVIQLNGKKNPVALTLNANVDGASFDRTSSFANWTRSYRADELVTSINKRNPITQLVDIRPVVIDESHRIAELEVTAEGGRKFTLKGLPVRWSLNVPDNLFVYDKTKDADGVDRYTFYGKGWGHGIGMCQVGAYGMAFRGYKFDQILKRYYTGIEIGAMK
jgi:stage II sporulation protein D